MIINVRGTNGSGKSEVARRLADKLGGFGLPIIRQEEKYPYYYINNDFKLAILGSYHVQCGGADRLKFSEIRDLVIELHHNGLHVFFESMLFSVEAKQTLLIHEQIPDVRVICLHVDPEQAIRNIYTRREKTGKRLGTSLDEERVRMNAKSVERNRLRLIEGGVFCRRATVAQAIRIILRWLEGEKPKRNPREISGAGTINVKAKVT